MAHIKECNCGYYVQSTRFAAFKARTQKQRCCPDWAWKAHSSSYVHKGYVGKAVRPSWPEPPWRL